MQIVHPLKPINDANSKVLILGTMPSVISRQNSFYYANPQNRFWLVLEKIYDVKLTTNEEKEKFLHDKHIALWDTIKSCEIKGSNDASIKNIKVNDIPGILKESPIKYIFCTGKKSYTIFNKYFQVEIPVLYLPSPSSANATFKLNDLIIAYQKIKDVLDKS